MAPRAVQASENAIKCRKVLPVDDELLSRARLAQQAGVSATTLTNWTNVAVHPLKTTPAPASGRPMFTWSQLRQFCQVHPELRGVANVLERASTPNSMPPAGHADDPDGRILRAAILDLRTAVDRATAAVVEASELAAQTAAGHAAIVRALRDTIRAYDSLTTSVAAPARPD